MNNQPYLSPPALNPSAGNRPKGRSFLSAASVPAVAPAILGALALLLSSGCTTEPGPFAPLDTTKYTLENTDRFVLLDQPAQYSVTCTGLQERTLGDGRLEVVANVKNRESRRIQVQINCVFKDEQGFSTGDETPFQTLILAENSTEAVRFTAMNTSAKKYTVRVRQAR